MKKSIKTLLFFSILALSPLHAATPTPPIGFRGVDHLHACTEIAEDRACDAQNMVGDSVGAASKRNGSRLIVKQAVSSSAMTSVYWAEVDKGTYSKSALIGTSGERIYVTTSPESDSPIWRVLRSTLATANQRFSFANFSGIVVMTGEALTDPIFTYDLVRDTFTELFSMNASTKVMNYRAKFVLAPDGYLVLANVMDVRDKLLGLEGLSGGTTVYPYRMAYSLFDNISSFTASRFIDVFYGGGQPLSGITERGGTTKNTIMLYTEDSAHALTYSELDLDSDGGDILLDNVASGFGCISPYALVNAGPFDVVPTKDGLVFYDGGKRSRLNLSEELQPFSRLIGPDYEKTLRFGTEKLSAGIWHKKNGWYVWTFSDPFSKPEGKANKTWIYDIRNGEWWPQKNWLASGFTLMGDELVYGDSVNGYAVLADARTEIDDTRKELVIDDLDRSVLWSLSAPVVDSMTVVEGTASLRMSPTFTAGFVSSMTRMGLFNFGEWPDGTQVLRDEDAFSFKAKISSIVVMRGLTIGLQYGPTQQAFNNIQSSVTLSSAVLFSVGFTTDASNSTDWREIIVRLSSFTFPEEWNDVDVQEAPFSRALTIYGIRFIVTAVASTTVNLDDLRVVQVGKNTVDAFYVRKNRNFGNVNKKDLKEVVLAHDKDASSGFKIDVFTDFGALANTIDLPAEIPKEIFVFGHKGSNGFTRLDSTDFSLLDSTSFPHANVNDYMNGLAARQRMVVFDKVANRMLLIDRSSYSTVISSFGSLGTGATNYDTANQSAIVGNVVLTADSLNNRIKKLIIQNDELLHDLDSGDLGTGTTQYLVPTGIAANLSNAYVCDDGNFKIVKLSVSTLGYVSERRIDSNTIGDCVLAVDQGWLYAAYNRVSDRPYFQDVVLEKRTLGDMSLVQRKIMRPRNVVESSTYTISGDIALLGKHLFIGFTRDLATTGVYFAQKLLKDGFDLVDEYQTAGTQFSIAGDAEPYLPTAKTERIPLGISGLPATYVQLLYRDSGRENIFRLVNESLAYDELPY